MGWLELLPLLKRLLPLLIRVTPMLEGVVAMRGTNRAESDAALQRLSEDWATRSAELDRHGKTLQEAAAEQGRVLQQVARDVANLRQSDDAHRLQLLALEQQAPATARFVRIMLGVCVALLVLCTGLLAALFVTHR